MNTIVTGSIFFPRHKSYESYAMVEHTRAMAMAGITGQGVAVGIKPLVAYVNRGRWLVKCECGGAEYMWEYDGKAGLFMCQSCWNASAGHQYRPCVFPKERKLIEAQLTKRPLPNRNWKPGETVLQLENENMLHKAELLK